MVSSDSRPLDQAEILEHRCLLTVLLELMGEVSTRMSLGEWGVLSPPSSAPDLRLCLGSERGAPDDAMT